MQASTRLLALRAAAKVTLSASIFGCGGATVAEDRDASFTRSGQDAARARDARADVGVTDAHARGADARNDGPCPGLPSDPDASVSAATFACCTASIKAERRTEAGGLPIPWLDASVPEKACCGAVIHYVDQEVVGAFEASQPILSQCCEVLSYPEGPACTPWGPPMPPAMTTLARLEIA